jgi:tetratricopeptide (TPR) repeat protein
MTTLSNKKFELAISQLQSQDFARAQKNLLRVIKDQPGYVGALNTLAILLARSGKHAQAEKYFRKAIQVYPSSDATYSRSGPVCPSSRGWARLLPVASQQASSTRSDCQNSSHARRTNTSSSLLS